MNRIFRKVWSRALGMMVVASELARGRRCGTTAGRSFAVPALSGLAIGLLCAGPALAQDEGATTSADADRVADVVEDYLQSQEDAANDRASSLMFNSNMASTDFQARASLGGGAVTPMGVINPGGLAGGTLPGLVNHLQQFLVGGNYQQCGLLGNGQLLPDECLTISRANFRYAFTGVALFGADIVTLPNVADLNGNRPADHTTVIGRGTSGSYLTVTNAQYGSQRNNPNCTLANLVGVCIPGLLGTYTWSTLPAQDFQIIIGDGAAANGSNTVVMGTNASHTLPAAPWTGTGAPDGNYAARLGNAVVVGHGANGTADRQVLLGANASSVHANSVALGADAVTNRGALVNYTAAGTSLVRSSVGSVSIGNGASTRQLTNLAAGTSATDAVNVEQMQGAIAQVNAGSELAVTYDSAARGNVTLEGATGTTISNLAPGTVSAGSTQAINGSQLHAASTSVASALGGNAAVGANGSVTGPTYSLQSGTFTTNNVGSALSNLDGRTTGNTTAITSITNGTAGLVRQDPATLGVTVAGSTGGTAVSFANNAGAGRVLSGVAAGTVTASGTQAVNTGQLFATGSTLATRLGGNATLGADGTVSAPVYTLQDGLVTANDVGTALSNLDDRTSTNTTSIATNTTNIATNAGNITNLLNGAAGLVQQTSPGAPLTVGAQTGGTAVAFGNSSGTARALTGVAAGAVAADSVQAINGGQLFASNIALAAHLGATATVGADGVVSAPTYSIGGSPYANVGAAFDAVDDAIDGAMSAAQFAVQYDNDGTAADRSRITLGDGAGGVTTIANVAAGTASGEAVNHDQLSSVVSALGGGAAIDPTTGAVTGPAFSLQGGTVTETTVGGALTNLDGRTTGNSTRITNLANGIEGLVRQAGPTAAVTVAGQSLGTSVSFFNSAGTARTLGGVAAGALGIGSLQAVNGAQLFGVGSGVAGLLGAGTSFNTDGSFAAPSFTIGGEQYTSVGAAFTAVNTALGTPGGGTPDPGAFAVRYIASTVTPDTPNFSRVDLAGPGGTVISNLAAGTNDLEAVNVGQLRGVVDGLGGNAQIDAAGAVIAPSYALQDGLGGTMTYNNAGDALDNLDDRVAGNTTAISQLSASGVSDFLRVNSDGTGAEATGEDAVALGESTAAYGARSVAIGEGAVTGVPGSAGLVEQVAIGHNASATALNSTAVGSDAAASGAQSSAFGSNAQATGASSVAIGRNAAAGGFGTAVGMDASATGARSTALGQEATAGTADSVALGQGATAAATSSVALGAGSAANRAGTVSVGTSTAQRQIVNVADGSQATDAVNLRQLTAVEDQVDALDALAVQYDDATSAQITLAGGAGGTTISNLAAGDVTAISTDAVRGSQLYSTAASMATHLGGGAAVGADGAVTAPAYSVSGQTYANVGLAFGAVDDALDEAVAIGARAVQYDQTAGVTDFGRVTLGNGGAARTTLANVAAGVASGEAINHDQLSGVVATLGGGASIDTATGAITAPAYSLDDGTASGTRVTETTIGGAIGNLDGRTTLNTTAIRGLADGTLGLVRQDAATLVIGVGSEVAGTNVDFANNAGLARRLSGVATGTVDTDAVNLAQLRSEIVAGNADSALAVQYAGTVDTPDYTRVNLTGAGGTTVANVRAGIAAGDAVNVAQLSPVVDALGGGALIDATTGAVTAPSYRLDDGTGTNATLDYDNVGSALSNLDNRTATNTTSVQTNTASIVSNTTSIQQNTTSISNVINGTAGLVQRDPTTSILSVGADVDGDRITMANYAGAARRLTGVASGIEAGDAVNLAQLTALGDTLDGLDGAAVRYVENPDGSPDYTRVALAGVAGTTLSNVAAGTVGAASTDAINGAQLSGVSTSVATALGGAAGVNSDGSISAPSYTVRANTYANVGEALAAVDGAFDTLGNLDVRAVQYDVDGAGVPTGSITLQGQGGVSIGNLAAGIAATDAVNISQLAPTVSGLGGGAGIDPATGAVTGPSYSLQGGDVVADNVGDALSNIDGRTSINTTNITTNTQNISSVINGTAGLVRQDPGTLAISVAGLTGGDEVTFANVNGSARRLSGVADGVDDTDAASIAQLRAVEGQVGDLDTLAVRYDTADQSSLTLGGAEGTVLGNLAAGQIAAGSMQAVTGGQMFAGMSSIASIFGGGAAVDTLGGLVAPQYRVQGAFFNSLGDAITALDTGLVDANSRIDNMMEGGMGWDDPLVTVDGKIDGSEDARVVPGMRGVAIGADALKGGMYGVAVGGDSFAAGDGDIAIGGNAKVYADRSTALGTNSTVTAVASEAVVVGESATVAATGGVALGRGSSVSAGADGAVALGQDSVATRTQTVSVGRAGNERQVVNVAAGTEATDAVNVSQLRASEQGTVRYDTAADGSVNPTQVTLNDGGAEVQVRNVRAGTAGSDAVNVNQMNAGMERALQSANEYTDARLGQMESDVWEVDRGYRAGVASAMAVAGLPQAYMPGKSMVAAAVSGYEQEAGLAVGITTISEDGKWVYKFSGTTNTRNDMGVTVGAGIQW